MKQPLVLRVKQHYFDSIKQGTKTVEGRINEEKYGLLMVGDALEFTSAESGESLKATVTALNRYASFEEYLEKETLALCLPGVSSIHEGVSLYRQFPGYHEKETIHGVLAIQFKKD